MDVAKLYRLRFPEESLPSKDALWEALCAGFFQQYVGEADRVLDLGAGHGEFLRHIRCGARIAVETNPDAARGLPEGTRLVARPSWELGEIADGSVDVVMASNFFEHLPSKERLLDTLAEVRRVLSPAGRLLVLQPNLAVLGGRFFDFLDHNLPLTDRSMEEALGLAGLVVRRRIPRFLPYTTRSALPKSPWLVRAYLAFPPAWRVLGGQMFILAERSSEGGRP